MKLDSWQKEVLETKGNIVLRSGRQVGKSTVISIKAGDYAMDNPKKSIMVIASVERQAQLIFEKILEHIYSKDKKAIMTGKYKPTKSVLKLKNGSIIRCLPTGLSGYGIRGFTINLLIADEAAFINENVWAAVTPMLATTGGDIILLSTPCGKVGYFFDCFDDESSFSKFHVSAEDVAESREEPMRTDMLHHQKQEKGRMTKLQYAQEYLGLFLDDLRRFFPTEVIKRRIIVSSGKPLHIEDSLTFHSSTADLFLGVDFAGYGDSENAFVVGERYGKHGDRIIVKSIHITTSDEVKYNITGHTIDKIKELDKKFYFRTIYVDDGGLGSPILDMLLQVDGIKRKIVGINNARREIERGKDGKQARKKTIMKVDLYANTLRLFEQGKIDIPNDPRLIQSLESIQFEIDEETKEIKIFGANRGRHTHITEALNRACWSVKDKGLNIWVEFS